MKALLVAGDKMVIDNISQVLKSKGYDTIVYQWLLKALDNIEEIAPHIIIISTLDYPRHWKTLVQYAKSGFGDYAPQIILYTDENFTKEEQKKAEILNVRGTFDSVGVDGLDKLRRILDKKDDIYSGRDISSESEKIETTDDGTDLTKDGKMSNADGILVMEKTAERLGELTAEEEIPTVASVMSIPFDENEFTLPGLDELKKLLSENAFAESENNDIMDESDSKKNFEDSGEEDMSDEMSIDDKLAEIMNANKADQKEKAEALKLETKENSVSFVFTNPITLAMVSGIARNYNGLALEFTPDIPGFIMNLSPGTKIDIASMKVNNKIENVFAEVMSNDAKKLALAIKKIS